MKCVKIVTAGMAAKAMGTFSAPYLCSNAEALVEEARNGRMLPSGSEALPYADLEHQLEAVECHKALCSAETSERELFWFAEHSVGGRLIEASQDAEYVVPDWGIDGSWLGYDPTTVKWAEYTSATSGATLEWTAIGQTSNGLIGALVYSHPEGYKGSYFGAWENAESVIDGYEAFELPTLLELEGTPEMADPEPLPKWEQDLLQGVEL